MEEPQDRRLRLQLRHEHRQGGRLRRGGPRAAGPAGRGGRPLLQVHVLQPGPGDDRPGHRGAGPGPRGGGRLQPAHARADLPRALSTAGLNPYFLEMANIREQCSWVHDDRRAATDKATALTAAAVQRVAHHEPLEKRFVDMCPTTLVIGGGITGLTAALELAESDQPVILVERDDHLGGNLARVDLTAPYLDSARDLLTDRITRVIEHRMIDVISSAQVEEVDGFVGNFRATRSAAGDDGALSEAATWAASSSAPATSRSTRRGSRTTATAGSPTSSPRSSSRRCSAAGDVDDQGKPARSTSPSSTASAAAARSSTPTAPGSAA